MCFCMQDDGRNTRRKYYGAVAPHKIHVECRLERERNRKEGKIKELERALL